MMEGVRSSGLPTVCRELKTPEYWWTTTCSRLSSRREGIDATTAIRLFRMTGGHQTEMESILRRNGIEKLVIYGIATDYCVRATAIDALRAGFQVIVIEELSRGVAPDTSQATWEEMKEMGAIILQKFDVNRIKGL